MFMTQHGGLANNPAVEFVNGKNMNTVSNKECSRRWRRGYLAMLKTYPGRAYYL